MNEEIEEYRETLGKIIQLLEEDSFENDGECIDLAKTVLKKYNR